ncbi:alpha/beta hydrolase [uncultured Devosia sp.]|uniref:alpha/beta hydrolase n=1 Tax=uncultured Devosia sp. TaxID=211434 RepID=UPI0035CA4CAC
MQTQFFRPAELSLMALATALMLTGSVLAQDAAVPEPMPADAAPADAAAPASDSSDLAETDDSGTMERAHPEMKMVLEKLMELGAKPVHTLSVEEARLQKTPADAVVGVLVDKGESAAPEAVGSLKEITIPGAEGNLKARVYTPAGEGPFPVIVYFHGGGWVIADPVVYDASERALSNQANAIVVGPYYSKGPEHRFSAAQDDAIAVYKYVVENGGEWNADTDRIAVAGESAGGNLAVNVAIAARDQKLQTPDAVIAVYPVAGADLNTPSYIENQNATPLGKADIEWFVENYANSMDDTKDTRFDLVHADLSDLPPTTIIGAEIDPLASEGKTLADNLTAAGVEVKYQLWDGVTHEFFGMAAVVPEAQEAQDFAGESLRAAFGTIAVSP